MISLTSPGAAELGQYHAMTVMEWQDVTTVAGSRVLLLRIRNPWGRSCWGGAWTQGQACFFKKIAEYFRRVLIKIKFKIILFSNVFKNKYYNRINVYFLFSLVV